MKKYFIIVGLCPIFLDSARSEVRGEIEFSKNINISGELSKLLSVPVLYHQHILIVEKGSKSAVISFEAKTAKKISYQLISKDKSIKNELVELYKETKTKEGVYVEDIGSQLKIKFFGETIEWSAGSEEQGYIYYDPQKIKLRLLNKRYLSKIKFQNK
jgi:uncharacterized membrane protein YcgQ (UPF0703/DUF1980 family)